VRALLGQDWVDGLGDYHRPPGHYRIEVDALLNLERLDGLYPVRARDPRMVWNYLLEIGPRATVRKIVSRTSERFRNEKFVSCGVGRVIDRPRRGSFELGERVVFVWPAGPACAERIVLPEELLHAVESEAALPGAGEALAYLPEQADADAEGVWWRALRGWHPESGAVLQPLGVALVLKDAERVLAAADWTRARRLAHSGTRASTVLAPANDPALSRTSRPRAALFGYGNYAKTVALPGLAAHLSIDRIHELDPTQIPLRRQPGVTWNTSPELPLDDMPDAVIVAGYHHTHAPLAAEALAAGAAVLVEKPVATTRPQLHRLLAAMRSSGASLFSGYQRRYLPFNDLARRDLGVGPGDPISYHAVVFEVPLPPLHWYRWPSSRSRLLSNGCHWFDHFLYLNDWAAVSDHQLAVAPDGQLNCSVTLENGAFMTLVLTDQGSRRLGVRDHVELRAGAVTVTIEDMSRYRSENASRILARRRIGRLEPYRRMYDEIGRRIASGAPGDSLVSVQRSAGLVLDLEEQLSGPASTRTQATPRPRPFAPALAVARA
jgi:predicted dehydrogenase